MTLDYAVYDGMPVRLTFGEAWTYVANEWVPMNSTEAVTKARLVSQAVFEQRFPDLSNRVFLAHCL